jgi:hypothetical protein
LMHIFIKKMTEYVGLAGRGMFATMMLHRPVGLEVVCTRKRPGVLSYPATDRRTSIASMLFRRRCDASKPRPHRRPSGDFVARVGIIVHRRSSYVRPPISSRSLCRRVMRRGCVSLRMSRTQLLTLLATLSGGDVVRQIGPARRDLDEEKQRAGQEGVIRVV